MKNKFCVIIIFIFVLLSDSCKKEPLCACGVEHPEVNILWLKEAYLNMWSADFYMLNYLGTEYIIISDKEVLRDGISVVYDCQGRKLCEDGGFNPGGHVCNLSDPKSFWDTYNENKILLFQLRKQQVILPN